MEPSAVRVAYRRLTAGRAELTGITRKKVADLVNRAIQRARVGGIHRDSSWVPVQRIWKEFERMGIPFGIVKSEYGHEMVEGQYVPTSKTWTFEVPFTNDRGRPQVVHGRVVASGAGSVSDPLESYDVVAYAN